jgi:hypothetical protein
MVIAAMTILSVLVTEFTYVAQVNSKMAFDSLDQVRAHYLAKSAFKLSLLRLKAYQQLLSLGGGGQGGTALSGGAAPGGGGGLQLPPQILNQIWQVPFIFPIPTELPGMTALAKDEIQKFQNDSGLKGNFLARIESDSTRLNINSVLRGFQALATSSSASPSSASPSSPSPSPSPSFDPEGAQKNLTDYMNGVLRARFETDPDFEQEYRDFRLDELMDHLFSWLDFTYQPKINSGKQVIPFKQGPFYTMSELRLIHPIDDTLFDLFAPTLTAQTTQGININLMGREVLRALIPQMTLEETQEFFEYRDNPQEDNQFKRVDDFYTYLEKSIGAFRGDKEEVSKFRAVLKSRNIELLIQENAFKISVRAQVNQSSRVWEAFVKLEDPPRAGTQSGTRGTPPPGGFVPSDPTLGGTPTPGAITPAGLRIMFMRLL